ncbi:MAG: TetR/AcrR family transcriptional regulator [Thermodesulfobacteriota bacterium]|nr:TetR/AcrR family transcriptional regulator [Thermodesulfobacteriota bacterium]
MTRKEAVLRSATRLFAEKGFDSTPTSEVAKAAGVAEGTVFHHFRTKEDILMHIFEDIVLTYFEEIESQAGTADSGLEAVEKIVQSHFRFVEERSKEFLVILRDIPFRLLEQDSPFREVITSNLNRALGLLRDCIDRGKKDGSIRDLSSQKAAFILQGMLNGLCRQTLLAPVESPDLRDEVLAFCRYGLGR